MTYFFPHSVKSDSRVIHRIYQLVCKLLGMSGFQQASLDSLGPAMLFAGMTNGMDQDTQRIKYIPVIPANVEIQKN